MTIEHGAIMEILATPSSSSSRSPSISWQACQKCHMSVSMCTKVLGRFIGDVIFAASITKKKKTFLCLDGCCHHSNEIDANVAGWIFLFNATAEHFRIRHPFSRWVVTHSTHSRFQLPWTHGRPPSCSQKWTNTLPVVSDELSQLSPLGPTWGTSNGGILTL